ncbi:glycosyltransferase [soil metagenome]
MELNYSFIIPVFNRPNEIAELLQSMVALRFNGEFEIVIIEDGSALSSEEIITGYKDKLNISYFTKSNTGPGDSRNFGMTKAAGNYFLILDSDVVLPKDYLLEVDHFLRNRFYHCFGGPDGAHVSFTNLQKAINYAMTSFLTTGGIRGKEHSVNKFQPRSFNMGLSKEAFEASRGFGRIHPGEDPDLSLRLQKLGYESTLIPAAKVYHKRRIDWNKFSQQVIKFGKARPILNQWHPGSARITYWFPTIFLLGLALSIILMVVWKPLLLFIYIGYLVVIGVDATIKNKSFNIGVASVFATLVQFWGYGGGFMTSVWKINVLKMEPQKAFPELFFNGSKEKRN